MAFRIATGALALTVALVALQHATRTDLPPADHFVSEYANGGGGWVMQLAFAAWAAGLAALAALVWRGGHRVVAALVAVGAAGAVLCGLFATQTVAGELPAGVARTDEGRLHDVGSLLVLAGLLLGALLLAARRRDRPLRRGTLALAAWLLLFPAVLIGAEVDAPGWGQRGIIASGWAWQALVLWRLRYPTSQIAPSRSSTG
jgi:hypothetical protein